MRKVSLILLLASLLLLNRPGPLYAAEDLCQASDYSRALCAYRTGDYRAAENAFLLLSEGERDPVTIKALYFLARSRMKLGKWEEASADLRRIYLLSKAFYQEWNGDFLLGECRRASGKG